MLVVVVTEEERERDELCIIGRGVCDFVNYFTTMRDCWLGGFGERGG